MSFTSAGDTRKPTVRIYSEGHIGKRSALKQRCDTLLYLGKWYPCDLGIASASMAERIGIIRAGDWQAWIKPVGEKTVGSDHLPIFIEV